MSEPPNVALDSELCEACLHYEPHLEWGYCRRFPPTMAVADAFGVRWPRVRPKDWCGEYQHIAPTKLGPAREIVGTVTVREY